MTNRFKSTIARAGVAVGVAVSVILVGCATRGGERPRSIDLAAFTEPPGTPGLLPVGLPVGLSVGPPVAAAGDPEPVAAASPPLRPLGAGTPPDETIAPLPATPATSPRGAIEPGAPMIVDSMVGQVNGRPIFADAFFAPIEDRLIALREQVEPAAYPREAGKIVFDELRLQVVNALFLAEAESTLTVQEKTVGLRSLLRRFEEQVIARYDGSEEKARREIFETEGRSLEAYMEEQRDRVLISRLITERINPRVIVSWRDIEREYQRRVAEFNPPATVSLARIRLDTAGQADLIADVARRLEGGEPFMTVAETLPTGRGGPWQTFEVSDGDLSQIEITNEQVRAVIHGLGGPGATSAPFELGRSTWWVHVVSIEQPPVRSLYDPRVQRMLTASIRNARRSEAEERYIASLLQDGIYDELNAMAQRLVEIALLRYAPR